ncbi:MAG: hypothetical protein R3F37_04190 [Candidatus Competibacteraceae bacterium]
MQQDQQFRKLRRAFYERVIQVYPPPNPDPGTPILRLTDSGATYTRETGFIPPDQGDHPACIF